MGAFNVGGNLTTSAAGSGLDPYLADQAFVGRETLKSVRSQVRVRIGSKNTRTSSIKNQNSTTNQLNGSSMLTNSLSPGSMLTNSVSNKTGNYDADTFVPSFGHDSLVSD